MSELTLIVLLPMTDANTSLGSQLRALRERQNLSLRQLERHSQLKSGYLSQLERGEVSQPTPSTLQRLAEAYEVPVTMLMQWAGYATQGPDLNPKQARALKYLGDDPSDEEVEAIGAVLEILRKRSAFSEFSANDKRLHPAEVGLIRGYSQALLSEAGVESFPTPLDDLMAVAKLVHAGEVELTPDERRGLRRLLGTRFDRVMRNIKGMFSFDSRSIWLAADLPNTKRRFVEAHEIGHHILPIHKEIAYIDNWESLDPNTRRACEREANQVSIELLAQGDRLREVGDSSSFSEINVSRLARSADISLQATARRLAEDSKRRICAVIWHRGKITGELMPPHIYCSESFDERYGWRAGRFPRDGVRVTAQQAAAVAGGLPMLHTDARERAVELNCDALNTPYALIALIAEERSRVLADVFPLRRKRVPT